MIWTRNSVLGRCRALLTLAALMLASACAPAREPETGPLVLAAASLQDALTEAAQVWQDKGHAAPVLSFAGTPALARQIEAGAPADLFIAADEQWMDDLAADGHIRGQSRRDLLGNSLVLIAAADSETTIDNLDSAKLTAALGPGHLALADPDAVPAGRYARQAFESLALWDQVAPRVIPAENVRLALALVARGEAALGVVYASDARAEPQVRVVHALPNDSHTPIVYPAALLAGSTSKEAAAFLDWLSSDEAATLFRKHGFTVPGAR